MSQSGHNQPVSRQRASTQRVSTLTARREFLKFLAASPYVAAFGGVAAYLEQSALGQVIKKVPAKSAPATTASALTGLIASPSAALNVFDFEEVAHRKVRDSHWAYMISGVDDDATLRANREGYQHIQLRPRRLRDATKVDMRVELFGTTYNAPIFLCPTSAHKAFWPRGEEASAGAAKARNAPMFLSSSGSTGVEDVNKAFGRPVWYQLYAPSTWESCQKLLQRVQDAGCSVIALTVDNTTGRNSETYLRTRPKDMTICASCHVGEPFSDIRERPMYDGIDMKGGSTQNPALDWPFADRIRQFWKGKFLIKGIDTREDARLAVDHGLDGIVVSNHGGRATETYRGTIEALPEVVAEVNNRVPVFVDGGVRRGTDAFKALALGAKAVGFGRPLLWALGAFGQPGVDRVLEILQGELKLAMGNCGTRTIAEISRPYVATMADWKL